MSKLRAGGGDEDMLKGGRRELSKLNPRGFTDIG